MLVLLDRQHLGKPSKPGDHGAVHGALRETDLTDGYIAAASAALRARGHVVAVLTEGEYGQRHAEAIARAKAHPGMAAAYLACHVNAGGGTYALVEHDARSAGGKRLADALAAGFAVLPGVSRGKVIALHAGECGWVCLDGIYAGPSTLSAALLEPGFIDVPAHAGLWTAAGLERVGAAISRACERWAS